MEQIITSLLDNDWYKYPMGQLIWRHFRDAEVTFSLTNRTKSVRLAEIINEEELRYELDCVRNLRYSGDQIDFLRSQRSSKGQILCDEYLRYMHREFYLPPYDLKIVDGQFDLTSTGPWQNVSHWEIYALPIINELYYRTLERKQSTIERCASYAFGIEQLKEKNRILGEHPEVSVSDFGTRRRYSRERHELVVRVLAEERPRSQFIGTSNVELAMKLGLPVIGTSAHELPMVIGALYRSTEAPFVSQNRVLKYWWNEYGHDLSIALTDTLRTPYFLKHLPYEVARDWKGFRQDSGDPIAFGEMIIAFYESLRIDPREKLIVFSDGLDIDAIVRIANYFRRRIRTTFGWGTNLTNDW
ncbi:MAG: nicotinate phosphoribosyltransferase, partial [Parcubacteria group bacterium Greene0416_14]